MERNHFLYVVIVLGLALIGVGAFEPLSIAPILSGIAFIIISAYLLKWGDDK